jgi:hypothetical protein
MTPPAAPLMSAFIVQLSRAAAPGSLGGCSGCHAGASDISTCACVGLFILLFSMLDLCIIPQ